MSKDKNLQELKKELLLKAKRIKQPHGRFPMLTPENLGGYGWYLGIPLFCSVFIGNTLDRLYPHKDISWVLICLLVRFIIGFVNAQLWLIRQSSQKGNRK